MATMITIPFISDPNLRPSAINAPKRPKTAPEAPIEDPFQPSEKADVSDPARSDAKKIIRKRVRPNKLSMGEPNE